VLGSGRRLFTGNVTTGALRRTDSVTTTTGVLIATYQQAPAQPSASRENSR
jgi:hypothetical protein